MPEFYGGSARDLVRAIEAADVADRAAAADGFERRLEAFLNDPRFARAQIDSLTGSVEERIAQLEEDKTAWGMYSYIGTAAHNTNTTPALSANYDNRSWLNGSGQIVPDIPGYYQTTGYFIFTSSATSGSSMPASSRAMGMVRLNNVSQFGSCDFAPTQGTPDFTTSGRILPMNGTTDYITALIYQFTSLSHPWNVQIYVTVQLVERT